MPMSRFLVLFLAVLSWSACQSPSVQNVAMPDLEAVVEDPSLARIYFLRRPQFYGRARMLRTYENNQLRGRIAQGHYLCWETSPGRKLISAVYERRVLDGGDVEGVLGLECEAGKVYYCAVEEVAKNQGAPRLEALSASEGQAMLPEQKPANVDR
ncbi:MAG: hypothetical protein CMJ89_15650 [Planctomycetes bacterium]|nr:hypothetical protein [Planctomycetota bacterium]